MPRPASWPVSAWVLVVANLLPLGGVLFLGWETAPILWLYWLENLAIGALTIPRLLLAGRPPANAAAVGPGGLLALKLFLVPFFCFHYGMFCFGHGTILAVILGGRDLAGPSALLATAVGSLEGAWWAILGLAGSHALSFVVNDVSSGHLARSDVSSEMMRPYGRIVVLHLAVLFGAMLALAAGSAAPVLVLLVFLKLGVDVWAHLRQRVSSRADAPVAD
jgi:hypothetical protein